MSARLAAVVLFAAACSGGGGDHTGDPPGPQCGNQLIETGEQCDDGNLIDGDDCETDCTLPACGNGIVDGNEVCDDGNTAEHDGCTPDCRSTCGDGYLDPNETCDDGNRMEGDGCRFDCTLPHCRDGVVDPGDLCLDSVARYLPTGVDLFVDFAETDADGDGDLDLLVLAYHSLILYRNTAGQLTPTVVVPFAQDAQRAQLAIADLDKDGDVDVVMMRARVDQVQDFTVALNDGGGLFAVHQSIAAYETAIRLEDMDKDGDRDIVFVNGSAGFAWLTNDGQATFSGTPINFYFDDFDLADLDGDGDLDGTWIENAQMRLFKNNGGTFSLVTTFPDPGTTSSAFGDVDGDSDIDLAYVTNGLLAVRKNDGTGVFSSAATTPLAGGTGNALSLTDYDGDGDLDALAIAGGGVTVMANGGTGTFAPLFTADASAPFAAGDLDGNGRPEIATLLRGYLQISFDDGATAVNPLVIPASSSVSNALADVDGDGDIDLLDVDPNRDVLVTHKNDGSGRFREASATSYSAQTDLPRHVAVGDIDHDGDIDAIVSHAYFNTLQILINDGNGVFTERDRIPSVPYTIGMTIADLDGDGYPEVAVFSQTELRLVANVGGNLTSPATTLMTGLIGTNTVAAADMDGDGSTDLVVSELKRVDILYNGGTGGFGAAINFNEAAGLGFAVGDFDADAKIDFAVINSPYVRIWRNVGLREYFAPSTVQVTTAGTLKTVVAADIDARPGEELVVTQDPGRTVIVGQTDKLTFSQRLVLDSINSVSTLAADANGDGARDLLTTLYGTMVYRARP